METIDDKRIDMLLAERARRGVEARMRVDAEARFGSWYRRRQRRYRIARAAIGVTATVVMVVIMVLPQPDGRYLSDLGNRSHALYCLNQMSSIINNPS
ncbi:MAG: hypothetical protein IJP80_00845 [Bacteroidales bacterium]|nr:hypothetical protein [Bacteroidales bacterium]